MYGVAENLVVLADKFDSDMIPGAVRRGLAAALLQVIEAGGKTIEVVRIMITNAGQKALDR
jgi:hypothetical protein